MLFDAADEQSTFFLKTTLDADYHATNVRLNDQKLYERFKRLTRVQEVDDYGKPSSIGSPAGPKWWLHLEKLFNISRCTRPGVTAESH